jgi:glycosyltransferase involved in cell wall biosynthesis
MINGKITSIIGTVGVPAKYGGFETLVEHLTKNQGANYEMIVYCSSKSYDVKLREHNKAKLKYINLKANGIQSILYDIIAIFKSLKGSNTLLILGVSGCIVLPFVKLISNNRILVNIDGLEWKRAKWGGFAKWFLKFSEKIAVKYADKIITDNKVLQDYVKTTYDVKSRLIAYGADHVTKEALDEAFLLKYPYAKNYAFNVCRIEPENNIHIVLEAFSMLPERKIVWVGNWLNSEYGKSLRNEFSDYKNIFLLDPIYDQIILNQFRSNCNLYIHGHSAGGTNPGLVEAMYLGLPIFAFGVDYNKETTENKAFYFDNASGLVSLLKNINEEQLIEIGRDMKVIAKERYTWSYISSEYCNLFK